jgi:hypothetical protein
MKELKFIFLCLLLMSWFFLTIFLVLSLVGCFILMPYGSSDAPNTEERRSTWMKIGISLMNEIIKS